MKALTLQQPWATLIALGKKSVETRKWHPKENPGHVVICSSKKPITGSQHERRLASPPFAECLDGVSTPASAMLAVARIDGFERTDRLHYPGLLSFEEWSFGDYSPGRWAWLLANVIPLSEPVSLTPLRKGQKEFRLGLWELSRHDQRNLDRAIEVTVGTRSAGA